MTTDTAYDYDLITLGAGSGGVAASRRAAALGAKVLIAENSRVGGTCVIRGCVPKKLMMYAASFADSFDYARGYGWSFGEPAFDMSRWADAKAAELDRLEGIYLGMLERAGVTLVRGHARIVAPHTVEIDGQRHTARHILIATGGHPNTDTIPGLELAMTSNGILDLREIPESLLVVGAGFIALEFASIMARLGSQVHLVYRGELPLRGFDDDLRQRVARALETKGVQLHAGHAPQQLERDGAGYVLHLEGGGQVRASAVLNATGRSPNSHDIGLESVGISVNKKGAIPVDADSLVASAVFTDPPLGTVGLTEAEAADKGPIRVFESDFRPMKDAFVDGQGRSYMKLVVDAASDKVLGIHMVGADAPEIIQSLAVAISCGATKADFDRTIAVHPTAAEEFVLMREPSR